MNNFINYLLGGIEPLTFLGLLFYALLGALLSLLLQTTKRDIGTSKTPYHFDWHFLWCDNTKRIITTLLLIVIVIRFLPELTGITITDFWAVIVGLGNDKLAQLVKDKTDFLGQKKPPKPAAP